MGSVMGHVEQKRGSSSNKFKNEISWLSHSLLKESGGDAVPYCGEYRTQYHFSVSG